VTGEPGGRVTGTETGGSVTPGNVTGGRPPGAGGIPGRLVGTVTDALGAPGMPAPPGVVVVAEVVDEPCVAGPAGPTLVCGAGFVPPSTWMPI
jgi:hypothetical protein